MKRPSLLIVALVASSCAPRGTVKLSRPIAPQVSQRLEDETYFHNIGITWDGKHYYTVNGGNEDYGRINIYDEDGNLISSVNIEADARSIFYNPKDRMIYLKTYMRDLLRYDPKTRTITTVAEGIFHDNQSSVALDPDGKRIYELVEGTLFIMEFPSMRDIDTLKNMSPGEFPYGSAVAASRDLLFTWDENGRVYVHNKKGEALTSFEVEEGLFGMSLSWAHDLLWGARDADGSSYGAKGTWIGYSLGPEVK